MSEYSDLSDSDDFYDQDAQPNTCWYCNGQGWIDDPDGGSYGCEYCDGYGILGIMDDW